MEVGNSAMYRLVGRRLSRPRPSLLSGRQLSRNFYASTIRWNAAGPTKLNNILGGGPAPPVQVRGVTPSGIELEYGLILPSACAFIDGHVFLWNVPTNLWNGWGKKQFELFEVIVPKPGKSRPR